MSNMTVSKALKLLFTAEILTIVSFVPLVGGVLAIVALVMSLIALFGAARLNVGYRNAFIFAIAGMVVSIVEIFAGKFFGAILGIVSTVLSLGLMYFVIMTTSRLLTVKGMDHIAKRGANVWTINLVCTIASVVLSVLVIVMPLISSALAFMVTVVELVGYILYLVFLYKSFQVL